MKFVATVLLWAALTVPAFAVPNDGEIPVIAGHSWLQTGCSYEDNALKAFEEYLEMLHSRGWVVVPLRWVAEWVAGDRDGSTLPDKAIAITFDDGAYWDWYDYYLPLCGSIPSVYRTLYRFKHAHPELPSWSPQVTSFVIGSRATRESVGIGPDDTWWWPAQNASGGLMSIQNHSFTHPDFTLINTASEAGAEVQNAAMYIASTIGVWPDLFAFPYGRASENAIAYLSSPASGTYAAFCAGGIAATRASDRYCIPRFVYGEWYWRNESDFIRNVLKEPMKFPQAHHIKPPVR